MNDRNQKIDNTQRLLNLQRAIIEDRIKFLPENEAYVQELMAISLSPGQLLEDGQLSRETLAFVRATAGALSALQKNEPTAIGINEAQIKLFFLFDKMFTALTGSKYESLNTEKDVRNAALLQIKANSFFAEKMYKETVDELENFYQKYSISIFCHAKELGGLKLVLGGQRTFGPSAQYGIRKMALYADTQLIPDPIYPFFEANLELRSTHVELLKNLYQLLQLKPLVDADLPTPPILVFPSFEKSLENYDVKTQVGFQDLALQVIRPICNATIESMEDLVAYVNSQPDEFVRSAMHGNLFIPPGTMPGHFLSADDAIQHYLTENGAFRSSSSIEKISNMPRQAIILTGILERLGPQYHLIENGSELEAQPMLTQDVHWHFFERCAQASAIELNRHDILSIEALQTIRALQDEKLSWLSNVPIPAIADILRNQENSEFRKELEEYTKVLFSAGTDDLDRIVREVQHGIRSLVQKHQKTISDIERRYAPKYQTTWIVGGMSVALGIAAIFLPILGSLGVVAPIAAAAGTTATLAKHKIHETAEKRIIRKNLIGVLAKTQKQ